MSKNAGWSVSHVDDYEGKRFVVDGDLIELYAYEYGVFQPDVAKDFHAVQLEDYEKRWLDEWVRHHDEMLQRTNNALENENAKLRELCEDMHEWMERVMYDGSARRCEYELIVSRMQELGIEVK